MEEGRGAALASSSEEERPLLGGAPPRRLGVATAGLSTDGNGAEELGDEVVERDLLDCESEVSMPSRTLSGRRRCPQFGLQWKRRCSPTHNKCRRMSMASYISVATTVSMLSCLCGHRY